MNGRDVGGRPCIVAKLAHFHPSLISDPVELVFFIVFALDALARRSEANGADGFTAIVDMEGWGMSNFSLPQTKLSIELLQVSAAPRVRHAHLALRHPRARVLLCSRGPQEHSPLLECEWGGAVFVCSSYHAPCLCSSLVAAPAALADPECDDGYARAQSHYSNYALTSTTYSTSNSTCAEPLP